MKLKFPAGDLPSRAMAQSPPRKHGLECQDDTRGMHVTSNGSFPDWVARTLSGMFLAVPTAHGSTHQPEELTGGRQSPGTKQRPRETCWRTVQTAVVR